MTNVCAADWRKTQQYLTNVPLAWTIHAAPVLPSTQLPAKDAAKRGAAHGTVFVTDFQSDGRGRRDRGWLAQPGRDLTFSTVLRPSIATREAQLLSFAAAVAVTNMVGSLGDALGKRVGIKWPNDVLIGGRKMCGIICESAGDAAALQYAVVGIGVNVNRTEDELPQVDSPDRSPATSLRIESGESFDLPDLLGKLLVHFDRATALTASELGRGQLIDEYRASCLTVGRDVRIVTDEGDFVGRALDVGYDGTLLVADGGREERFHAGDVIHARLETSPS